MGQNFTLASLEDSPKMRSLKKVLPIFNHQKITLQQNYLLDLLILFTFSNQTIAFDPKEQMYAITADHFRIDQCECQLTTSNKVFSLKQLENCKVTHAYVTHYQRRMEQYVESSTHRSVGSAIHFCLLDKT